MTGVGIWEGLTTMIEIFERQDPTRTGASGPSTGADSTLNKEGGCLESAGRLNYLF